MTMRLCKARALKFSSSLMVSRVESCEVIVQIFDV